MQHIEIPQVMLENYFLDEVKKSKTVSFEQDFVLLCKKIAIINYLLFKASCDLVLDKEKFMHCLLELKKIHTQVNLLPKVYVEYIKLLTSRVQNIINDFDNFQFDPDFNTYVRSQYSYWISYNDFKETQKKEFSFGVLKVEIENHFNHYVFFQWLIELFTDISKKIRCYLRNEFDFLFEDLMLVQLKQEDRMLERVGHKLANLTQDITIMTSYFSPEEAYYLIEKQKSLNATYEAIRSEFEKITLTDQTLQDLELFKEEVIEAASLIDNKDRFYASIFYCSGLLGIEIQNKSVKELILEIKTKVEFLKQSLVGNKGFYWINPQKIQFILKDKSTIIDYLQMQFILANCTLRALLSAFDISSKFFLLASKEDESAIKRALENVAIGKNDLIAIRESFNAKLETYLAGSETVSREDFNNETIVFKNIFELSKLLEELTQNSTTQAFDENQEYSLVHNNIPVAIGPSTDGMDIAGSDLEGRFVEAKVCLKQSAETINALEAEVYLARKDISQKISAEVKRQVQGLLFANNFLVNPEEINNKLAQESNKLGTEQSERQWKINSL